jgi:hypothetical protein
MGWELIVLIIIAAGVWINLGVTVLGMWILKKIARKLWII